MKIVISPAKSLALIQAYRLEMGTKMAVGEHKNLYEFWKPIHYKRIKKKKGSYYASPFYNFKKIIIYSTIILFTSFRSPSWTVTR